jgi:hypothetical protein
MSEDQLGGGCDFRGLKVNDVKELFVGCEG